MTDAGGRREQTNPAKFEKKEIIIILRKKSLGGAT